MEKEIRLKRLHLTAATVARTLLALVFLFSGFVKAIDPLGTAYKIQDYCTAFSWTFLYDYAKFLAFLLFSFELVAGLTLLLGLSRRKGIWAVTLFLTCMTALTCCIYMTDPIRDCGCFGDAVSLTNGQTFAKNIVLLALSLVVLTCRQPLYALFGSATSRWAFAVCLLVPVILGVYSLRHLPMIDFRPYRIGNKLQELMTVPQGAPTDSIVMEYLYEKEGRQQRFTAVDIPYQDTAWHYLRREARVVRKGYVPPIHDFTILHPTYGDITQIILEYPSYTFLWISSKLETANHRPGPELKKLENYVQQYGYLLFVLTASTDDMIDEWSYEYDLETPFCSVDETTLRTIVRSNPGLVLLKNGEVYNKWSAHDLEQVVEALDGPLKSSPYGEKSDRSGFFVLWKLLQGFFFLLLLVYFIHLSSVIYNKIKQKRTSKTQTT